MEAVTSDQVNNALLAGLIEEVGADIRALPSQDGIPTLEVTPASLLAACAWLRAKGFNMCLDVGGVDYLPRVPRFEVVYHLLALPAAQRIRLRVPVDEGTPVPTVSHLWPSANWAEREVYDLFGIRFTGHPNLSRILMPQDWEGHPLRKDFPLRGNRPAPEWGQARSQYETELARIRAQKAAYEAERGKNSPAGDVTPLPRGRS